MACSADQFSHPSGMGGYRSYSGWHICTWNGNNFEGMTILGRNDTNTEGMTFISILL
jgi:hypothetical protein